MQEIDYVRLSRLKRRCMKIGFAASIWVAVFTGVAFSPLNTIIGEWFTKPTPVLSAVKLLAEEQSETSSYATAIRLNPEMARECKGSGVQPKYSDVVLYNFTPIPTLTEFNVDEESSLVCAIVYEYTNRDSSKNPHDPTFVNIRKTDYMITFGNVPKEAQMVRLTHAQFKLDKSELVMQNNTIRVNTLANFYRKVPRTFPVTMTQTALTFHKDENFQKYLERLKNSLGETKEKTRAVFVFIGFQGIVAMLILAQMVLKMYEEYIADMMAHQLPVAKLRYFLAWRNVDDLTSSLLYQRKRLLRAQNQERELDRKVNLATKAGPSTKILAKAQTEETAEQRQERRRNKIEGWCRDLRRITPPEHAFIEETEEVCKETLSLFNGGDFEGAKKLISTAIDNRRSQNKEIKTNV